MAMIRLIVGLAIALLVSSCVTNPVPEGYTGPLAKIEDTYTPRSERAIDVFFLDRVNGKRVENALSATVSRNYGRGFSMEPVAYARDVPAQPAVFSIAGRTHYAAPILELTNTVYEIKGDISFTPEPNRTYIVRGSLGPEASAVWIEDAQTKALIGDKIEVKNKPPLGVLEK
jgi:hypothetical protein